MKTYLILLIACLAAGVGGCKSQESLPDDSRTAQAQKQVQARWGKTIADLPAVRLVFITANNENIVNEFGWAFQLHYAKEYGRRVQLVRKDVGGGGSAVEKFIFTLYSKPDPDTGSFADSSSGIDILWGGGDDTFGRLARPSDNHPQGLLEKLAVAPEVLAQIGSPASERPDMFGGLPFYDKDLRWVGSAASSFGFLYNSGMLARCGLPAPRTWQDVGDGRFTDLVTLADPSQSSSVARSYQLIVQSAPTWPEGWARLLEVLSNAKRFSDSAGGAANAPVLGDCLVAATIDFFGLMRVAEAPDQLTYVNPPGQTTYSADPIGILKNPPCRKEPDPDAAGVAQRFVDFVLSTRGQALWALKPGQADGPIRTALGRLPIRRDVYELYKDQIPALMNFYLSGQLMSVSPEVGKVSFAVLRQLTTSAAVDNVDQMRRARRRLNELAADADRRRQYLRALEEFNRLPDDVRTVQMMAAVEPRLRDQVEFYNIAKGWRDFFREKYQRVAREP